MALYDDPLDAARKRMFPQQVGQSFFPAVNQRLFDDRSDLQGMLNQTPETSFLSNAPPSPTPTPTPTPRSYFGGGYRNTTGFQGNVPTMTPPRQFNFGLGMNRGFQNTFEEWQKRYGFNA